MARINITRGAWATSFALETVPSDKILYVHLKVQDAIYLPQRKKMFNWTNLNPVHSSMLVTSLIEIDPIGSAQ